MIKYDNCPVCRSTDIQKVMEIKDHSVSGETFQVFHCNSCTHRFTNPVPKLADIGPYYQSEDYISHSDTSKGLINQAYQIVRKRTLRSKRSLVQKFTGLGTGAVLDIGCGTGAFLGTMLEAGWEVTGVEPDEGARRIAKENWKVEPYAAEAFYGLKDQQYDAITLWHVLEHIHDLEGYLNKIHALLKPNGKLMVAI